ncbi:MAG: hypothetical protein HY901_11110 [Deltaproteobacteria bacterium]|nr:hypothetical protein [Deltaproteobacteria bacterium]
MLSLAMVEAPKKVLVVGLGGGAMPMFLRKLHPEAQIEVFELDPDVVKVARKYFGFAEDKKLKASVGDGRALIEAAPGGWDLPTVEFLKMLRGKLTPGALVVGNVWEPASWRNRPTRPGLGSRAPWGGRTQARARTGASTGLVPNDCMVSVIRRASLVSAAWAKQREPRSARDVAGLAVGFAAVRGALCRGAPGGLLVDLPGTSAERAIWRDGCFGFRTCKEARP